MYTTYIWLLLIQQGIRNSKETPLTLTKNIQLIAKHKHCYVMRKDFFPRITS